MKKSDKGQKKDNVFKRLNFGRRTFLKGLIASGVGGLSGALFRPSSGMALGDTTLQKNGEFIIEPTRKIPIIRDVDILVVGGGMAGVGTAAALSIKRGVSPRDLKVDLLQQELVKAGAFLG